MPERNTAVPPGLVARNACAAILLVLGLLQMAGAVLGVRALRGIGAASAASPLPKVFSDVNGLETFSLELTMAYEDGTGRVVRRPVTPELYGRLRGPYWRRNVYGAALAYGPRLPREIWEAVFCYGLAPGRDFRRELGLPDDARAVSVTIRAKARGRERDTWTLEPQCTE